MVAEVLIASWLINNSIATLSTFYTFYKKSNREFGLFLLITLLLFLFTFFCWNSSETMRRRKNVKVDKNSFFVRLNGVYRQSQTLANIRMRISPESTNNFATGSKMSTSLNFPFRFSHSFFRLGFFILFLIVRDCCSNFLILTRNFGWL